MSLRDRRDIIQLLCLGNRGAYIAYSQGLGVTKRVTGLVDCTTEGICQALAAKWIIQHANGSSLWSWLYRKGTRQENPGCVLELVLNFIDGAVQRGPFANPTSKNQYPMGMTYQDFVTEKYMALYGVKRRQMVQRGFLGNQFHQIGTGTDGFCLANRLQLSWMNAAGGCYVLIVIRGHDPRTGRSIGHAMSAFVGQDIAFFDPNYGEFWFPSHNNFVDWFRSYWNHSGYQGVFTGFYLLPYGKAV